MCVHVTVKPWTTVGGGGHAEEKGGEAGFSLSCNTTTSQRISKILGFVFLKFINFKMFKIKIMRIEKVLGIEFIHLL